MDRTNIYLEPRQTEALDRIARDAGTSRAEIIRSFVDRCLAGDEPAGDSAAVAIMESFGTLSGAQPPERKPGAREKHLERVWSL
ncbi:MAG: ribbon-helix-helix domain-containing protein [Bifidobacteriaceae bacterium]|jgi:hypothetical protein|nr:ribbon-helix-helix domain-containing protein [Bifidobacteriaceae bacterium]